MLTTNELGGERTTRTPLLGATLKEMLNYASESTAAPPDNPEKRELYEAMHPKYNHEEVKHKIEQNCRFKSIQPHLIDVLTDIAEPVPIISRYGSIIASEGNISAIVGQAKSKKTFLCSALVGAMLRPNGTAQFGITPKQALVLWVDTEQSASHVQRVIKRIHRMAGVAENEPYDKLVTLTLREELTAEVNSCVRIMQEGYPNGIDRHVMVTKLVESEGINRAYARVKVSRAIAKGLVIEKGGVLYLP